MIGGEERVEQLAYKKKERAKEESFFSSSGGEKGRKKPQQLSFSEQMSGPRKGRGGAKRSILLYSFGEKEKTELQLYLGVEKEEGDPKKRGKKRASSSHPSGRGGKKELHFSFLVPRESGRFSKRGRFLKQERGRKRRGRRPYLGGKKREGILVNYLFYFLREKRKGKRSSLFRHRGMQGKETGVRKKKKEGRRHLDLCASIREGKKKNKKGGGGGREEELRLL